MTPAARLRQNRIVLAVTGSIGLVSLAPYVRVLRDHFVLAAVLMSEAATRMMPPRTLAEIAAAPVETDTPDPALGPLSPTKPFAGAELLLVMPATANTLAKAALGASDDLISQTITSFAAPILFVPSMNPAMWTSKPVQRNVLRLREDGRSVLDPGRGLEVSDFSTGLGGMASMGAILHQMRFLLASRAVKPPASLRTSS